ncbi:hypothetical protein [Caproicibacter sp.]|uniref:hypothetical protein n=1 Tax=Caproicibacter sp. TaxID=2814884 RepID=UPI00398A09A0
MKPGMATGIPHKPGEGVELTVDHKRIKKLIQIFFILLSIIILFHLIPIPFHSVYDAKEIKLDDPSYLENCQIHISGYYHLNVFQEDTFSGQITVSDYRLTSEKMSDVKISSNGDHLDYSFQETCRGNSPPVKMCYSLGLMFSKRFFHDLCILVYEENTQNKNGGAVQFGKPTGWVWGEENGYCIVPNASSREEALNKLRKLGLINTF